MKKTLIAAAAPTLAMTGAAHAAGHAVKIGVLLGYTGPIESLVANMGPAAEMAMAEVSESGALLGGAKVTPVIGDSTCVDAAVSLDARFRRRFLRGSDPTKHQPVASGLVWVQCAGRHAPDATGTKARASFE